MFGKYKWLSRQHYKEMKNLVNLEEKSGYLIYQLNLLWKREMSKAISAFDLTYTQYLVLMAAAWLGDKQDTSVKEQKVTQSGISEFLHIDRMLVSRMVNKLKKRDLIRDFEDSSSIRSKPLLVTEDGRNMLKKVVPMILEREQIFYKGLTAKEHNELNHLLGKVLSSNQLQDQPQSSNK